MRPLLPLRFGIVLAVGSFASGCSEGGTPTKRSKRKQAPPTTAVDADEPDGTAQTDAQTDANPALGLPETTNVLDQALVAAGREAFESRCAGCHATPGAPATGSRPPGDWLSEFDGIDPPLLRNLVFRSTLGRRQQWASLEDATRSMLPPDGASDIDDGLNDDLNDDLIDGLVAYQQSLLCGSSDFDRDTLNAAASRGWDLFRGKAACSMCHNGPLFADGALHLVAAGKDDAKTRFETPSLRGVSRSAPYFHDGSAASLADAVARMAAGGAPGVEGKDPIFRPVDLDESERADLVAFLEALDCRSGR